MQRPCKSGVTATRRKYKGEYTTILTCIARARTYSVVYPGQITYLRRLGTMTGFLILRARSRAICLPALYFVHRESRARLALRGHAPFAPETAWRDPKRSRGSAGRMETPACVHKHVREPLCKFLNTTGPYIHTATRVGVRKIKLVFATNVSRLKRPLGSNKRRRTSRANNCHKRSARPCVRLSFESEC